MTRGSPDPELKRFSIEHDRAYILPILRRVREMNPDVFYFSSPWSPPGWMKWNKSMLGGSMSRQYLSSYAQYMLKFIQAYGAEGVPIQAITTQNEIDTDQHGQMPACTWSQECETEFITDHIGPLFEKTGTTHENMDPRSQLCLLGQGDLRTGQSRLQEICEFRGLARLRGGAQHDEQSTGSASRGGNVFHRRQHGLQRSAL